ncbi:hypothetical protein EDB89DRAFT_1902891 [Lactarius sanguifluus]|nr:hypothetical protein EDB89DRAFT_1902891 [Lactarius sanguifluus]
MVSDRKNFCINDESHTLILVKRVPRNDLIRAGLKIDDGQEFSYGRSEPIIHMVKLKPRTQLRKETRAARIALYKKLAKAEGTRRIAGVVYESLAQEMLEDNIALELVPMVESIPDGTPITGDGANRSLVLPIDITPAETFVYHGVWPGPRNQR